MRCSCPPARLATCVAALCVALGGCDSRSGGGPQVDAEVPLEAGAGDALLDGAALLDGPQDAAAAVDAVPDLLVVDAGQLLPVGAPCSAGTACRGGTCIPATSGFPNGYCTHRDCDLGAPTTTCLPYGGDGYCFDARDAGAPFALCLDRCDPDNPDCRTTYECADMGLSIGGLCLPQPVCGNGLVERGEECEPPGTTICDLRCQNL